MKRRGTAQKISLFKFVQKVKKGSEDVIKSKEEALFYESEVAGQRESINRIKNSTKI